MYNSFNQFITRVPHFPFISLDKEQLKEKMHDKQVQEAIYIASPVLYAELQKYQVGEIIDKSEQQRIESAFFRYLSRMSSRCTPFGLFAGCSVGETTGDKTNIVLDAGFSRSTRLDMYFLCALSQELAKQSGIKENLLYYPNTTLYPVGNKYRYIEYQYIKSRRTHRISSVERSLYLDAILKTARKGAKINDFITYLINNEIPADTASEFIQDLIDSQLIVSELSPSVTGGDFLTRIISVLDKVDTNESTLLVIKEIQQILFYLDSKQRNTVNSYKNIIRKVDEIKIPCEENFLFQVDMTKSVTEARMGTDIIEELQSAMVFLNRITLEGGNAILTQFQQAFYNRYEDREVPLMEVLDPELGIGYPVNTHTGDISPLLDNFFLPGQVNQGGSFQSNDFQSILFKKTIDALSQNKKEIVFNDEDVKNFSISWIDLPPTIYTLFEIVKTEYDNTLIQLKSFSGTCGANLLARFSHTDTKIVQFVNDIIKKEEELMPNVILAEIAHLPDSRVGNILSRPHLRNHEILYLAHSALSEKQLIYMSDLYLSIRQGRIYLHSKQLNKEIIPRLTTAHYYYNNQMPVYRFLCDMQMQRGRSLIYFNWGYVGNELTFRPRVRYKNTIISLATWIVKIEEMKHLFLEKEENLIERAKQWREMISLPQYVLLQDGDNELLVDWENGLSIQALFAIIKKRQTVYFTEFLFDPETAVVRDKSGNPYLNECIAVFYKNEKR
ncbi:hypothetical protein FACS1894123_01940 [Bacteroidia bacterium]|nr:hypothetical protein FACS1894123_01940 [Bacteroidia bacterium]